MLAKTLIKNAYKELGIRFLDIAGSESGATGDSIVTTALRKLSLRSSTTPPTSNELTDGREVVNDMLEEWAYDGIDLGVTEITAGASNLPKWSLSAVKTNAALRIAAEYGRPIPDGLAAEAVNSLAQLKERTSTTLLADGLESLNALMMEWDSMGRRLGYLNPAAVDEDTGLPDWSTQAVQKALAVRLAPMVEKPVSNELLLAERETKRNLVKRLVRRPRAVMPETLPTGSGNDCSYRGDRFYAGNPAELMNESDAIDTGEDVTLSLEGDTRDANF